MNFISWEIPSGAINWVNTVYTNAYDIYQVDDVWVDWVIYFNYTVTWDNQITLVDAPTLSIRVDYFTTWWTPPVVWRISADTARTIFTRWKNDTLPRVSNELFYDFLNDLNQDIYVYLKGINPYDYTSEQSIVLSSTTSTYSLNGNFSNVQWKWCGLFKLNTDWTLWEPYGKTSPWSTSQWYYFEWDYLKTTWWISWNAKLRYFPTLWTINAWSDTLILDDEPRSYPVLRNLINMLYNGWKDNNYEEIRSWNKYIQDVKNLALSLRKWNARINLTQTYV